MCARCWRQNLEGLENAGNISPAGNAVAEKRVGACLIAVGYRLVLPLVASSSSSLSSLSSSSSSSSSSFSSLGSRGGVVLPMMVTRLQSTNQVEMFSRIFGVMSPPVWVSRHLRTGYGTARGGGARKLGEPRWHIRLLSIASVG